MKKGVRNSMKRVDLEGVLQRSLNLSIIHRKYMSGTNALWHMDGNHKLIR